MRKIVAFNHVSADGYFASPNGTLDWVTPEDGVAEGAMQNVQADTILFGRTTYDMFESFWPQALEDPKGAEDPHAPGRRSPSMKKMAEFLNDAKKLVFSKKRKEATWHNSELKHDFDPREIQRLKEQPGKDILIFGSGSIASQLTQHGLIDEYLFVMSPVLLGSGRSLIHDVQERAKLELTDTRTFPSGVVMLKFRRENGAA